MARLSIPEDEVLENDLIGADMDLVEQLVEFRKLKGLDVQQVAKTMGVDRSVVSRFESISSFGAKNHTMRTVRRYAQAVGAYVAHVVVPGEAAEYQELADFVEGRVLEMRRMNEAHERTVPSMSIEELRQVIRLEPLAQEPRKPQPEFTYSSAGGTVWQ